MLLATGAPFPRAPAGTMHSTSSGGYIGNAELVNDLETHFDLSLV